MSYFLGIDISTTATKALLLADDGRVAGVASSEYPFETPHPLWSEQDPLLWWWATIRSVRELLSMTGATPEKVGGIGLTGQMHGLVLLDGRGQVLRPAILWNDQRTAAECDQMRATVGKDRLISISGNDALTGFTAPKVLWVRNHEPGIYQHISHILLPKDFVRLRLTGDFATDRAGGAGTQLFDLGRRDWSDELLEELEIDRNWLPHTHEGTELTGKLTPEAARDLGLMPGIPVFGGGGDQAAGAVGTGAVREGLVSLSLGTSGVVFASVDRPIIDPEGRLHAFCHAVPRKWHLMGVMLSAAGSLRWYRDSLAPGMSFEELIDPVRNTPAGSEGLFFLPYLTGERTPHPDPKARGAFIGLTVRHQQAHLTRAVLEGVAYGLRDCLELMRATGLGDISQVRASGGGVRSQIWLQILADVLRTEIATVNTTEGAAYGAALLAAVGAGAFPSVEEACERLIRVTSRTLPGADSGRYEGHYAVFRGLYPALKASFAAISAR